MAYQRGPGGLGVVQRTDAQSELGPGRGDERHRRRIDRGRVDPDDGYRGSRPQPGGQAAGSDQLHAVEHTGVGPKRVLGEVERVGLAG